MFYHTFDEIWCVCVPSIRYRSLKGQIQLHITSCLTLLFNKGLQKGAMGTMAPVTLILGPPRVFRKWVGPTVARPLPPNSDVAA